MSQACVCEIPCDKFLKFIEDQFSKNTHNSYTYNGNGCAITYTPKFTKIHENVSLHCYQSVLT